MADWKPDLVGWIHRGHPVDRSEVRGMIYDKLLKLKDDLGKKALRDPRTADELLVRKNYERVINILQKRYESGTEKLMERYRFGDFRDEITSVKRF